MLGGTETIRGACSVRERFRGWTRRRRTPRSRSLRRELRASSSSEEKVRFDESFPTEFEYQACISLFFASVHPRVTSPKMSPNVYQLVHTDVSFHSFYLLSLIRIDLGKSGLYSTRTNSE